MEMGLRVGPAPVRIDLFSVGFSEGEVAPLIADADGDGDGDGLLVVLW